MSRSGVTIREVAARAGVSHQTVSRVINQNDRVNPETRQRVKQAISELGYSPNAIARYMAHGRTSTLACISPNLTDFTFASIIEGAEIEARQRGYFLLTASASDAETFSQLIEQLISSRRAEGLMVINPYIDDRYRYLPDDTPTVILGACARQPFIDSIALDDVTSGAQAVQHLLDLGHRRIAAISGPQREDCAQDRQQGYLRALMLAGIQPDPELVIEGDWSATSGYRAVQIWLEEGLDFSAIFAQNDRMAVGALRALRDNGKRTPEDVSVIGFDDMPLASYFDPPLTTMRQDVTAQGKLAARLLIQRLENPQAEPSQEYLLAELVERNSTARFRQK
jgi:LacI family repressor for deo operon, udp, cdd, tsx, nupC, and nupG